MTRTSRSSSLPPEHSLQTPTWPAPLSPLPPHRLAKLANALGVSIPLPATSNHNASAYNLSSASSSTSFHDNYRRSPTPSAASTTFSSYSAPPSKFLLHVIPPELLPHDSDTNDLTPPPSTASGYHTQFKRGTLVPLYPTLQAQLAAIAKEYALPSTAGMILYLVSSTPRQSGTFSPTQSIDLDRQESDAEPGPRISEEIWKMLWSRVARSERDEAVRTPAFSSFGVGLGLAPQDGNLRTLVTRVETAQSSFPYPATPSPSTPSSTSDVRAKSSRRHPSSGTSLSESDTPNSSLSPSAEGPLDPRSEALDLPGLASSSLIPILAKVEFDIDKRKAGWYEPWIRSRKMNMARRAESRASNRRRASSKDDDGAELRTPLELELVRGLRTPAFVKYGSAKESRAIDDEVSASEDQIEYGDYAPLHESPEEEDSDLDQEEPRTLAASFFQAKDPLEDVFGSDADTWADIHAETQTRPIGKNPLVVDLALDGAALAASFDEEDFDDDDDDTAVVGELWERHARPRLSVNIPPSPSSSGRRTSSPKTAATIRRHVPPPLDIPPLPGTGELVAEPSPMFPLSGESTRLPYLTGEATPSSENSSREQSRERSNSEFMRSPVDDKRGGAVFDDLELGLDVSVLGPDDEFDENDPYDRRRSQYIMRDKLDEIEKALAQLSPRRMEHELADEEPVVPVRSSSLAPPMTAPPGFTRTNTASGHDRAGSREAIWPAVPFSALSAPEGHYAETTTSNGNGDLAPPRLALNGVPRDPPKSPYARKPSADLSSSESEARKRELEEETSQLNGFLPPSMPQLRHNPSSPVIPLSPDPFGRFPSDKGPAKYADDQQSQTFSDGRYSSDQEVVQSRAPSSRFSTDSVIQEEGVTKPQKPGAPLMSMKSIKKLWRKSNKSSVSGSSASSALSGGRLSPQQVPPIPAAVGAQDLTPPPPTMSGSPQPPSTAPPQGKLRRSESSLNVLHFNQESPYPIRLPSSTPPPRSSRNSPKVPASPLPPPTPNPPSESPVPPGAGDRGSVRKSILKSWKSASGLSQSSNSNSDSSRSSGERPPSELRRRRPSILGLAALKIRGSISSAAEIPPSPNLPEQYTAARPNRQSQSYFNNNGSVRAQLAPTPSSFSSQSSPPRAKSRPSDERRLSEDDDGFDTSEFEIVSPKIDSSKSLSYPYHGLDQ